MRQGPIRRLLDGLWRTDWGLTALLAFLLLGVFVAPVLISAELLSPLFIDLTLALILVSGIVTVSRRSAAATLVAAAISFVAIATRGARLLAHGGDTIRIVDAGLAIVAILVLTWLVLLQVFRHGPITYHRIQGAIAAYLLLGVAWANAYELVEILRPGALRFPDGLPSPVRLVYFSFVTLTTVGYGDITPMHPATRMLAISEALVGQLFPAILIGRLVSMEIESRRERAAMANRRAGTDE